MLEGKKVVVVGAGSGIGRSVALAAVAAGAQVTIAGRTRASLEETAAQTGEHVDIRVADASIEEQTAALLEAVGSFDHLVSTIGQSVTGAVHTLTAADVSRAMAGKLWAPFFIVKHGAPRISPDGSFTFFSGIRASRPTPRTSITTLVNGGLEAFARAMAVELAPVRVNVISPGIVDSGAFWGRLTDAERERMFADFAVRAPARRVGTPADQASAVLFAITNPFVTGTVLAVDGGAMLM
jgi:NAD(P)-dependent dehydrogenase (short-subunit alcohol dehydrogenase family)